MQLGIGTYTFGWAIGMPGNRPAPLLDEMVLLDRARAFGLHLVQFGDNYPLHALSAERLTELRKRAHAENIRLEIGARGLTAVHLHRYVDLCAEMGSELLRFVIDEKQYEPSMDTVVKILQEAEPALREKKVTLGIENHDRFKAREFAEIIERVDSPYVGICLDSVNSMGSGEGLEEVVAMLAPHTVNLHLKDFGITRLPHLMGFQIDGRPAGQGMLNIPWLVETVRRLGRCKTAILEQWVVPDDNLQDTLSKEAVWAHESIRYLKGINDLNF